MAVRVTAVGVVAAAGVVSFAALTDAPRAQCPDPFDFLRPSITVSARDRQRIDNGEPVVRSLPASGREVAVLAAMSVTVDGDRLAAWMRQIEALKRGPNVPAVARFSNPPRLEDLAAHVLDEKDLDRLRQCRAGSCDLKLTSAEIARVAAGLSAAGREWKPEAQRVFRQVMLDRVNSYRASGHVALGQYADGHSDKPLAEVARTLLDRSPYLIKHTPALVDYLRRYPNAAEPSRSEVFFYWSTDRFGGRPVSNATHVSMLRPESGQPQVLVAGRQLFATHYQNGSLSLTLLLRGCTGSTNYLVYVSRSEVDVIRGVIGWLARNIIEGRVEEEATQILAGLRTRLSHPPPAGP